MYSPGARIKKWLILEVSLTHLVKSRDLLFLEAEIVDSIFQWDVLKNMRQIKSYDDRFQAIRALTVQKVLKIRISSQKFLQNESFSCFLSDLNWFKLYSKKGYSHIHRIASFGQNETFHFEENCLSSIKFKEIMRFRKLWQMEIEIGSYTD